MAECVWERGGVGNGREKKTLIDQLVHAKGAGAFQHSNGLRAVLALRLYLDDVLEGEAHLTALAARAFPTFGGKAIHKLLLRQRSELPRCNLVMAFNRTRCGKGLRGVEVIHITRTSHTVVLMVLPREDSASSSSACRCSAVPRSAPGTTSLCIILLAQHEPHPPWFFTGVTAPLVLQSIGPTPLVASKSGSVVAEVLCTSTFV